MKKLVTKREKRERRRVRVRSRVKGSAECPRFNVFRSLQGMFVQLIDDEKGQTLVSINVKGIEQKGKEVGERKGKVAEAYLVGKKLAEKAVAKSIKKVVFDRAGYKFHGRVKALSEGAREGGLEF